MLDFVLQKFWSIFERCHFFLRRMYLYNNLTILQYCMNLLGFTVRYFEVEGEARDEHVRL